MGTPQIDFSGKTVLVIAAGGGIGSVVAERFAAAGAQVVAAARRVEGPLAEVVARIAASGGLVTPITMNITDEGSVAAGIAAAAAVSGRIDAMVNMAGVFRQPAPLTDMGVNLTAAFLCMKHTLAQMIAQGGSGAIVNTASTLGMDMNRANFGPYVTSKAGVQVLTRTAAMEGAPHGIRVNCVSPGTTATAMSLRPGETDADRLTRVKGGHSPRPRRRPERNRQRSPLVVQRPGLLRHRPKSLGRRWTSAPIGNVPSQRCAGFARRLARWSP